MGVDRPNDLRLAGNTEVEKPPVRRVPTDDPADLGGESPCFAHLLDDPPA